MAPKIFALRGWFSHDWTRIDMNGARWGRLPSESADWLIKRDSASARHHRRMGQFDSCVLMLIRSPPLTRRG